MYRVEFWSEPATLYRLSEAMRRVRLITGSVNGLIEAALGDDEREQLVIATLDGSMLVGDEIRRAALDATRPRPGGA